MFHMCGNPGWKSNFILLCSLSVLLRLKPCNAELPLRAGLIRCRCTNNKYHIAGNFVRQRFLQSNTSSRKFVPAKVFFHFCDLDLDLSSLQLRINPLSQLTPCGMAVLCQQRPNALMSVVTSYFHFDIEVHVHGGSSSIATILRHKIVGVVRHHDVTKLKIAIFCVCVLRDK